ncbi:hypothetical protein KCP77_01070 [Salmonella enterica subsp. enterica]|nr:hypothetical protein KCP77_01070 [Salmonella enterica subsp. enterica]
MPIQRRAIKADTVQNDQARIRSKDTYEGEFDRRKNGDAIVAIIVALAASV